MLDTVLDYHMEGLVIDKHKKGAWDVVLTVGYVKKSHGYLLVQKKEKHLVS